MPYTRYTTVEKDALLTLLPGHKCEFVAKGDDPDNHCPEPATIRNFKVLRRFCQPHYQFTRALWQQANRDDGRCKCGRDPMPDRKSCEDHLQMRLGYNVNIKEYDRIAGLAEDKGVTVTAFVRQAVQAVAT